MSDLRFLDHPESLNYILGFMKDPNWKPPTYIFLDEMLSEVAVVNWCTVLDDDDAFTLFSKYPGTVFLKKKGQDQQYRLLPIQFNAETGQVEDLA